MLLSMSKAGASREQMLTTKDVLEFPVPPADRRIPYGPSPLQFGDLRIPEGQGPFPVVVVVHGGCWLSEYSLDHIAGFCAALTDVGFATWSLEYRRVGDEGGGWPGTFKDVAGGADYLRDLAKDYSRPGASRGCRSFCGRSPGLVAGGPKPLAGRRERLPAKTSTTFGVVALAGVSDLRSGSRAKRMRRCGRSPSRRNTRTGNCSLSNSVSRAPSTLACPPEVGAWRPRRYRANRNELKL